MLVEQRRRILVRRLAPDMGRRPDRRPRPAETSAMAGRSTTAGRTAARARARTGRRGRPEWAARWSAEGRSAPAHRSGRRPDSRAGRPTGSAAWAGSRAADRTSVANLARRAGSARNAGRGAGPRGTKTAPGGGWNPCPARVVCATESPDSTAADSTSTGAGLTGHSFDRRGAARVDGREQIGVWRAAVESPPPDATAVGAVQLAPLIGWTLFGCALLAATLTEARPVTVPVGWSRQTETSRPPIPRRPLSPAAPIGRPVSPRCPALLCALQSLAVRPPRLGCLVAPFRPPRALVPPVRLPCGRRGELQSRPKSGW